MAKLIALPAGEPAPQAVVPLRQDLAVTPGIADADGAPTWVIHDPARHRFFNIGWLQYELLRHWKLRDPGRIAQSVTANTTLEARPEDVAALSHFFARNELVHPQYAQPMARPGDGRAWWSVLLHKYLFFRVPLVHPDRFLSATQRLAAPFFSAWFRYLLLLVTLLGGYLVIRQWHDFSLALENAMSLQGAIYFLGALVLSKCLHELGHAYTCKRYGVKVPTMGVAFLVLWPFLYTDTTESWKLSKREQRIAIGVAGVYVELCLAAFATVAWGVLADGPARDAAFFLASAGWIMTLTINANPLMRWDGYYVMADLLAIDNLQSRGFALGRWHLRETLFGLGDPPPDVIAGNKRRILIVWAYCTWIYRLVLFIGIALLVYHLFFKALGIFLMTVEITWFILKPLSSELSVWFERRSDIRWNRQTLVTSLLLISAVFLLAYPWTREVSLPAVAKPALYKSVFSPLPAEVTAVEITTGQDVAKGRSLLRLRAPDLEFRLRQANNHIALYQASLSRLGNSDLLEQREISRRRLMQSLATAQGLKQQLDQLHFVAPFSGRVVSVAHDLRPGRWVSSQQWLATVADTDSVAIQAYVTEDQLQRIRIGGNGTFYPDDLQLPPRKVEISNIDRARVPALFDQELADKHGGPIAVSETDGALLPRTAMYRVTLNFTAGEETRYTKVERGVVRILGQAESNLERIWRRVGAVLIRESGF